MTVRETLTQDQVAEQLATVLQLIEHIADTALGSDRFGKFVPILRGLASTTSAHADMLERDGGDAGREAAAKIRESIATNINPLLLARDSPEKL